MLKKFIRAILLFNLVFLLSHAHAGVKDTSNPCGKSRVPVDSELNKFFIVQTKASTPVAFDDIGCALLWRENQCTAIQMSFDATAQVFDYYTEEALNAKDAFYVQDTKIKTPRGYGIAAFKDRESAEKFISENGKGKILTYDDLLMMGLE